MLPCSLSITSAADDERGVVAERADLRGIGERGDHPRERHPERELLEPLQVVHRERVVHVEPDELDLVHPEVPVDEDLPRARHLAVAGVRQSRAASGSLALRMRAPLPAPRARPARRRLRGRPLWRLPCDEVITRRRARAQRLRAAHRSTGKVDRWFARGTLRCVPLKRPTLAELAARVDVARGSRRTPRGRAGAAGRRPGGEGEAPARGEALPGMRTAAATPRRALRGVRPAGGLAVGAVYSSADDLRGRDAERARDRDHRRVRRVAAAALDEAHVRDRQVERLGESLLGEPAAPPLALARARPADAGRRAGDRGVILFLLAMSDPLSRGN